MACLRSPIVGISHLRIPSRPGKTKTAVGPLSKQPRRQKHVTLPTHSVSSLGTEQLPHPCSPAEAQTSCWCHTRLSGKQTWQTPALGEEPSVSLLSRAPASEQRGYLRVKFTSPASPGFGLSTPGTFNCRFQPPFNNRLYSWPVLAELRNIGCATRNGKLVT